LALVSSRKAKWMGMIKLLIRERPGKGQRMVEEEKPEVF
jgi:hypothetical protein